MKTNPSLRMFKLLAILFAFGIALAQPLFATPMLNQLVITENSPTDLSVTYNGAPLTVTPVVPGAHDFWLISPPAGVIFNFELIPPQGKVNLLGFIEPENPALGNLLSVDDEGRVLVISDLPLAPFLNDPAVGDSLKLVSDSTTVGPMGFDRNNRIPIELTFHDDAGSTEPVPETGSTFCLLLVGLTALVGSRSCFRSLALG